MNLSNLLLKVCEEFIVLPNSLGIKRADMPQIPAAKLEEFLQYLKDTGHDYERIELAASELTPSQGELDTDKADKIWSDDMAFENPILVSADRYVLDGHHRWFAVKRNAPDQKMSCIMLSDNVNPSLQLMHDFDGSHKRDLQDRLAESLLKIYENSKADKETEIIKANKQKPENKIAHQFKAAEWTHPNGHPRCIRCGQEESVSGQCAAS